MDYLMLEKLLLMLNKGNYGSGDPGLAAQSETEQSASFFNYY